MFQSSKTRLPEPGPGPEKRAADTPGPAARVRPAQQSIIGADLTIRGDLICAGDLLIDGRVDGNITCRTLTLGAAPVINSKVEAETVRVCGAFSGEIRAQKVILTKTAKVNADIYQEAFEVERGAVFEGRVQRLGRHATTSEETGSRHSA